MSALLAALAIALGLQLALVGLVSGASSRLAYWKLDETGGPPFVDADNGHNGQCAATGCPSSTGGKVNTALAFDGATTGIDVPADPAFDWAAAESFSIELWMKGSSGSTCAAANQVFIGRADPGSSLRWSLGCAATTGYARFELTDAGGASLTLSSASSITDGNWHHLVAVRDGASNLNRLYLDGTEVASGTVAYPAGFAAPTAPLNLGYLAPGAHFQGALDEVALYDGVLAETDIRGHFYLARGYAQMCASPVTVMPLGDSITKGSHSSSLKGYRQPLYLALTGADYNVNFVGSLKDGATASPSFDIDHEGHSGFTDDQVVAQVFNWLTNNPAEVILLHIGTNDLSQNPPDKTPDDVATILDEIDRFDADATVVLAQIINRDPYSADTHQFNLDLAAMAQGRIDAGDKIILVDQESALTYPTDLSDGLHPNNGGYQKMANVWEAALTDFLPVCTEAPAITSTAVTTASVSQPYSYDVEASGFPVPTYTLTTAPVGMTINSNSGLISWTPGTTGTFNVSVRASNTSGADTQNFVLDVSDAPVCPADMSAFWKLDETSGTTFADSFDGHDGACAGNCPTPTTGQINGAQEFNGSNTGIDVPADAAFDWGQNDSFSIELWMKGTSGQACPGGTQVFVGRDDAGTDLQWWLGCKDGKARFLLNDINGNGTNISGTTTVSDGNWHHLVAVRDGASNLNRLYVDGTLAMSATHVYTAGFGSATAALNIGWIDFSTQFHFKGSLDEVALYRRALSATEVEQHYYNGVVGTNYCDAGDFAPTITSSAVTTATVGQPYSYDVNANGYPVPTYTLTTAPGGMTINGNSGLISWTPGSSGTFNVSVRASNSAGFDDQPYTIEVTEPPTEMPSITSTPITETIVGQIYNYDVEASGSPAPTYTLTTAPGGMTIVTSTGLISWTPGTTGTFNVTVEARNSVGADTQNFVLNVNDAPVCPADMSAFWKLNESASPYIDYFDGHDGACAGNCPTPTTGQINGAQAFNGSNTGIDVPAHAVFDWDQSGSFSIELWMKGVTGQTCPGGTQVFAGRNDAGTGLQWWFGCREGKPRFQLNDINGNGTTIVGTQTITDGNWHHLVAVRDGASNLNRIYVDGALAVSTTYVYTGGFGSATAPLNLGWFNSGGGFRFKGSLDEVALYRRALSATEVEQHYYNGVAGTNYCDAGDFAPTITSSAVTTTPVGQPYSYDVNANGYPVPTYTLTTAPGGMTINNNSGLISWTPGSSGAYSVSVRAGNSAGTNTQAFTLTVTQVPTITSIPVTTGAVGQIYNYDVEASGFPAPTYTLTTAPGGMTINNNSGLISWTPSATGTFSVTVKASNIAGFNNQSFEVTINQIPVFTTSPVTTTVVGQPYSYDVDASGYPAPTYALTSAPAGMAIDSNSGLISWTPATTGTFNVTVEASNVAGSTPQSFSIVVASAPKKIYLPLISSQGAASSESRADTAEDVLAETITVIDRGTQPTSVAVTTRNGGHLSATAQFFRADIYIDSGEYSPVGPISQNEVYYNFGKEVAFYEVLTAGQSNT